MPLIKSVQYAYQWLPNFYIMDTNSIDKVRPELWEILQDQLIVVKCESRPG